MGDQFASRLDVLIPLARDHLEQQRERMGFEGKAILGIAIGSRRNLDKTAHACVLHRGDDVGQTVLDRLIALHLETVGTKGANDRISTLDALRNGAPVLQITDNDFHPSRERGEFLCVPRIDRQVVTLL